MAGPKYRKKLEPRSMQAQINSFKNQMRRDFDSRYRTHSPAGNQYDQIDFNTVDINRNEGIRERQFNDGSIDSRTMGFENTYFIDPRTGQKFGHSWAEGPSGWLEEREIYPDGSGYGSYYDEEGNYSEYPIQLKGPQTWNYDPGSSGIMGLQTANSDDLMESAGIMGALPNEYQMAELTDDQKGFMRNKYFSPDLPGAPTRDELFNQVKDREDTGFFGFGAQEPTTREEFDNYYNNLMNNFYIT
jgi:hypothetical protein